MEERRAENGALTKKKPFSLKEKLAFCSGDIFCGGNQALLSVVYLSFLTEIIHISVFYATLVIMISKIWDAISDPMVGLLSDNTRTRFGRRRPFIFFFGLLIIPAMAFMWFPTEMPGEVEKIVYMGVSYVVYYTISTLVTVPYSSLSTEITTDVKSRSKVNLTRLLFSLVSTALCTLVPSLLFNMVRDSTLSIDAFYWIIVAGFGTFFTIPVLLAGLFSRERAPYPQTKNRFSLLVKTLFRPFQIKAYRKLLILYLAQAVTMDIIAATTYYYAHYVINMNSVIFLACFLAVQILAFPLVNYLVTRISKIKIYRFLLPLTVLGAAGIGFYPSDWPTWGVYLLSVVTAIGFAGSEIMPWIIFPDVVDIGVLSFKERNTGVFSSGMTLIRKLSSAFAIAIVGGILSLVGYVSPSDQVPFPSQPSSTIWGIRMVIFLSFAVFMSIAFIVSCTLKLTPEVSEKVKLLNEKHSQSIPLSVEEQKEEDAIVKEFVK